MSTIEELQADLFAEWRARESLIDKIKTLEDEVLVARRFAVSVVGQQAETQTLAEVVNGLAVVNHALKTRIATLEAQLAEVTKERDTLRALVAVGQLIVDANEVWPGKTVHTEEWRRLERKWRSLEGKG